MAKKIMCVDDSPTIRTLVKNSVTPEGWDFMEAENGQEALDKLSDGISVFVVDVNMPVMNGFELVKNIKKNSNFATVPIVFLTTESSDEMKQKGKDLGINGWIVKPFERTTLLKIIDMLDE